jgi:transcriptional regulator with XRE-family HTH domain
VFLFVLKVWERLKMAEPDDKFVSMEQDLVEAIAKSKRKAEELGALIRSRREEAKLSQADLAQKSGTTQQTVDRIERGETKHSRAFPKILAALKITDERALGELAINEELIAGLASNLRAAYGPARTVEFPSSDIEHLSVYTLLPDGDLHYMEGAPADYISRPEPLLRVRKGYALIIPDDRNSPVFRAGDIIFANPHLPIRTDNEVVFSRLVDRRWLCLIATVVEIDSDAYTIRHATAKPYKIKTSDWTTSNVIVGKFGRV